MSKGLTLIEVIIYCSIFILFAIYAIQSLIWIGNKIYTEERVLENVESDVYNIYFSNIYKRYKYYNYNIETKYGYLISSTTVGILNDGIYFNETNYKVKNKDYNIKFFDSI